MRRQLFNKTLQVSLQFLHVGVLSRLVEFLEMMYDPPDYLGKLHPQNQESSGRRFGKGSGLRDVCLSVEFPE